MRKEGNGFPELRKMGPRKIGNAAGRGVIESLQEQARNYT